ncbi:hypothetical protein HDU98_012253 [Podochytrium sp. JEL0797]|nr:hypothetical protein HDU98_012253 [Podochytrium sp. JEL0797]
MPKYHEMASSFSSESFYVVGGHDHCSPLSLPRPLGQPLPGHSRLSNDAEYRFYTPPSLALDETRPVLNRDQTKYQSSHLASSVDTLPPESHSDQWLLGVISAVGVAGNQEEGEGEEDEEDEDTHDHEQEEHHRTPPLLVANESTNVSQPSSSITADSGEDSDKDSDDEICLRVGSHKENESFLKTRRIKVAKQVEEVEDDDDDDTTPPSSVLHAVIPSKRSPPPHNHTSIQRDSNVIQRDFTSGSWATRACFNHASTTTTTLIPCQSPQHHIVRRNLADAPRCALLKAASMSCSPTRPELWGGGDTHGEPPQVPSSFINFSNTFHGSVCPMDRTLSSTAQEIFVKLEHAELHRLRMYTKQTAHLKLEGQPVPAYKPGNTEAYRSVLEKLKRGECAMEIGGGSGTVTTTGKVSGLSSQIRRSSSGGSIDSGSVTPVSVARDTTEAVVDSAKDVTVPSVPSPTTSATVIVAASPPKRFKRMLVMGLDKSDDNLPIDSTTHLLSTSLPTSSILFQQHPSTIPLPPSSKSGPSRSPTRPRRKNGRHVQWKEHVEIKSTSPLFPNNNDTTAAPLDGLTSGDKFRHWQKQKRRAERRARYGELEEGEGEEWLRDSDPRGVLVELEAQRLLRRHGSRNRGGRESGGEGGKGGVLGWVSAVVGACFSGVGGCFGEVDVDEGEEEHRALTIVMPLLAHSQMAGYNTMRPDPVRVASESQFGGLFVHDYELDEDEEEETKQENMLRWSDEEVSDSSDDDDF